MSLYVPRCRTGPRHHAVSVRRALDLSCSYIHRKSLCTSTGAAAGRMRTSTARRDKRIMRFGVCLSCTVRRTIRVRFTFVRASSLRVGTALPPRAGYCAGATQHRPVRRGRGVRRATCLTLKSKPPVGERAKRSTQTVTQTNDRYKTYSRKCGTVTRKSFKRPCQVSR